jgi:hypothetical protein
VLLAELEIWHSRPIAPTRRVAVGRSSLPVDPGPGFGGILLGGIVAAHIGELDPDLTGELSRLLDDLEIGRRIPQPRLRHRFQADRIGLARSRHRLLGQGDALAFAFDDHGAAASQILGACYAAGRLAGGVRSLVIDCVRRGVRWRGPVGPALVTHLTGTAGAAAWSVGAFADPEQWALEVLGFADGASPERRDVLRRFRDLLRQAHPDHGGDRGTAAARIAALTEARRILLA